MISRTPSVTVRALVYTLVLVMFCSTSFYGCATLEENKETAIGAGIGAAVGAAVGAAIGGDAKSAALGAGAGALLGGLAGNYVQRRDRDRTQAVSAVAYRPEHGNIIRIETVEANPARIKAGQSVNIGMSYTVITPEERKSALRETREVYYNGQLILTSVKETTVTNGGFTTAVAMSLPAQLQPGTYKVKTMVAMPQKIARGQTEFMVVL